MSFSLLRITLIFTTISSEFMTVFFVNFFVVTQFLKFWGQEEGINKQDIKSTCLVSIKTRY